MGIEEPTRIAGRAAEQQLLGRAIAGAAGGEPAAVFVHGEAGVGKTTLVRRVCEMAAHEGHIVLWGQCVRFGAASSPYRPLFNALRRFRDTDPTARARLDSIQDVLDDVPPEDAATAGRMLPRLERTVLGLAEERPTVLVIDDAQWADLTSLDLIGMLIGGFGGQRLAILVTFRDEDLGAGHSMHGWLSDLRRLPGVADIRLGDLGRDGIRELVLSLGVPEPTPDLVTEVQRRSGGNAYLAELLVKDLPPGTTELPAGLAPALREVLLARWHRLSPTARDVMTVLALGGRPYGQQDLAQVARELDVDREAVGPALAEAAALSVLDVLPGARYWFHHPLLAEVLGEMPPARTAELHAGFARLLEGRTPAGPGDARSGDLALHHERAGNPGEAFGYLLGAAEQARTARAYPEELGYLLRAERLWASVAGTDRQVIEHVLLLEAAMTAARRCMDLTVRRELAARALDLVDRDTRPLEATRVLLATAEVGQSSTDSNVSFALLREAVQLSGVEPNSFEHVLALSELAEAHVWRGEAQEGRRVANLAVDVAGRIDSSLARGRALLARAFARMPSAQALTDALEGYRLAVASGQPEWIEPATVTLSNCHEQRGSPADNLSCVLDGLAASRESGGTGGPLVAMAAQSLLELGELRRAQDMLRGAFVQRQAFWGGALARLVAARVACRTGAAEEAEHHLARAGELVQDLAGFVGVQAPVALAEHHLFVGEPWAAVDVVRVGMVRHSADDSIDTMLMWGARAAADLADRARDRNDNAAEQAAVGALEELVEVRTGLPGTMFAPTCSTDTVSPMRQGVFLAESARCRGRSEVTLWRRAMAATGTAGDRHEQALARWRLAQAILTEGGDRAEASAQLRDAHAYALEMAAVPLADEIVALARMARISLSPAVPVDPSEATLLATLSPRELEVLTLLVAGRTYAEIADQLFISIKTVSAHVSHLLRKTGTANRVQAAALGRRLGLGGREPESAPTASLR